MDFSHTHRGTLLSAMTLLAGLLGGFAGAAHAQKALPTDIVNIAAASRGGRIVSVSSVLDNQKDYAAENLIDEKVFGPGGQGSFGWASNRYDPINLEQVTIGFKDNPLKVIGKVVLNPAAYVARERWAKDVSIQVSTESAESEDFKAVAEVTLRQTPTPQEFKFLPVQARFVRLVFRTNYGSDRAVALGEVEIYEAISTADSVGDVIGRLESTIADLKRYNQTQLDLSANSPMVRPVSLTSGATPGAAPSVAAGAPAASVNIAATANGGKIVEVSSVFESERGKGPDPTYGPDKLLDGRVWQTKDAKPSYGWSSQGFAPGEQWVTIGFKDDRTQPIGKIVINPLSYQPRERWARRIEVQVSSDSFKNWKSFRTVKTLNLRMEPINQEFDIGPVEAKYVRLLFTANGPGDVALEGINPDINSDRAVSLGEVEIYPPRISSGELDNLISRFTQVLNDLKGLRRKGALLANNAEETAEPAPAVEETPDEETPEVTVVKLNDAGTRIKTAQTPVNKPH